MFTVMLLFKIKLIVIAIFFHLEIALPTILAGMEKNTLFEILEGKYIWSIKYFDFQWHNYDDIAAFVHPSKISKYNATKNGLLFCQKFIQEHIKNIY